MLLKHLYIMSLEYPGPGCALWFGGKSLSDLNSYIHGFLSAMEFGNISTDDDNVFLNWLKENGHFPSKGWCLAITDRFGDGEPAYLKFFELLNQFLIETRLDWFIKFNEHPQPSPFHNGLGKVRSKDIRNIEHVKLLQST